jgi:hypothetical protein
MTMPTDLETDAARLREAMAMALAEDGVLTDPAWRQAVEKVPRHRTASTTSRTPSAPKMLGPTWVASRG